MEYSSLAWIGAAPSHLQLLDNLQKKALKIIGVNSAFAQECKNIQPLTHWQSVAALSCFYKMQTLGCPADLKSLLPVKLDTKKNNRSSTQAQNHIFVGIRRQPHRLLPHRKTFLQFYNCSIIPLICNNHITVRENVNNL